MSKIVTTNDFIQRANLIHNNKYDYSKVIYSNAKQKVIITCKKHGEFLQTPNKHLNNRGCPSCFNEKRKYSTEDFIKLASKVHNNKYKYNNVEYINSQSKVIITCPTHGNFNQLPSFHLLGVGCPKCRSVDVGNRFRSNTIQFIEKAKTIHGNRFKYDKVDYKHSSINVIIICNEHGDFEQSPHGHLRGQGCPKCLESKGEKFIASVLDKYNIKYIREYKIPGTNYKFEYDFYLPELNILIEFHGEQHYKFNNFFHRSLEDFSNQKKRDIFKRELAKLANIPLIEFNYKHLKFMKAEQLETMILRNINK